MIINSSQDFSKIGPQLSVCRLGFTKWRSIWSEWRISHDEFQLICCFLEFLPHLIAYGIKTWRAQFVIFGTPWECDMMYYNWSKAQRTLTHYSARWRQKSELSRNWQLQSPFPHAPCFPPPPKFQLQLYYPGRGSSRLLSFSAFAL